LGTFLYREILPYQSLASRGMENIYFN